jgi:SynChlorMet cassette protein ScmD
MNDAAKERLREEDKEMCAQCKVPIANPMIVFREEFDDWAILFDPDTGKSFGINPVAALIWKLLDGKHDLDEILKEIKSSFSDSPQDLESDAREFMNKLVEIGFAGYEV